MWKIGRQTFSIVMSESAEKGFLSRDLSSFLPQVGTPDVDLLASRFNNKLHRFVFWSSYHWPFAVDALVMSWDQCNVIYAFSGLHILPFLSHRIEKYGILVVLILLNKVWSIDSSGLSEPSVPRASFFNSASWSLV